jgi:hypothetical protein
LVPKRDKTAEGVMPGGVWEPNGPPPPQGEGAPPLHLLAKLAEPGNQGPPVGLYIYIHIYACDVVYVVEELFLANTF